MYMKMIMRSFFRRKTRLSIIVISIILASSIVTAMSSVYFDINHKMRKELRAYGANMLVVPKTGSSIPQEDINKILNLLDKEKLHGFSPYIYKVAMADGERTVVVGMIPGQINKLAPYIRTIEGNINFKACCLLVGKNIAKKLSLKAGSSVLLDSGTSKKRYVIKGIIETGSVEDDQIIADLSSVQELFSSKKAASIIYISYLSDDPGIFKAIDKLNKSFGGIEAKPISKISKSESAILAKISSLTLIVAAVIFVLATFSVAITLAALIFERRQEIGLKKAIGASNKAIFKEFAGESIILSFIAGTIGWVTGLLMAQLIGKSTFQSYIDVRSITFLLAVGTSVIISVVSSVFPIKTAMEIEPAVVLKDE